MSIYQTFGFWESDLQAVLTLAQQAFGQLNHLPSSWVPLTILDVCISYASFYLQFFSRENSVRTNIRGHDRFLFCDMESDCPSSNPTPAGWLCVCYLILLLCFSKLEYKVLGIMPVWNRVWFRRLFFITLLPAHILCHFPSSLCCSVFMFHVFV